MAVREGAQLAQLCGAEIILLNVRPEFMERREMVMLRVSAYDFLQEEQDIAVAAKAIMEEELRKAGAIDVPHQLILREGKPWKEIIATAEELRCDLIVITTTGRDSLLEHLKGSDAERLVATTHIPLLVFPTGKAE